MKTRDQLSTNSPIVLAQVHYLGLGLVPAMCVMVIAIITIRSNGFPIHTKTGFKKLRYIKIRHFFAIIIFIPSASDF